MTQHAWALKLCLGSQPMTKIPVRLLKRRTRTRTPGTVGKPQASLPYHVCLAPVKALLFLMQFLAWLRRDTMSNCCVPKLFRVHVEKIVRLQQCDCRRARRGSGRWRQLLANR